MRADGPRVLHLIERLTLGGAARSLIAAAELSHGHHRAATLRPSDTRALALAVAAGVTVVDPHALDAEIAASDVLHVHFWNTPELYAALRRSLPPCRIVLTSHVLGTTPPHVLTAELIALADRVIATTPATPIGCAIPAAADFRRLARFAPVPQARFTVGYVGSVDFAKIHPDYVAMHGAIGGEVAVLVAGTGNAAAILRRQAEVAGIADQFAWLGQVDDVAGALARMDVFGYPLCEGNFATSELVLHEAMYAGLPCVVLANGGAAHTVVHGETGYLVQTGAEYAARLRELRDDPALRHRLGRGAAAHARAQLGAERIAPRIDAVYAEVQALPRRARSLAPVASGCDAFVRSLGAWGAPFAASLAGNLDGDAAILAASDALASADTGGILHYRRAYPEDAALRFWSGLVLLGQGRHVLAAGEFKAAQVRHFDSRRSEGRLRDAITRAQG